MASTPDPTAFARNMARVAEQSRALIEGFLAKQKDAGPAPLALDPIGVGQAFLDVTQRLLADPNKLVEAQVNLWRGFLDLQRQTAARLMGGDEAEPVAAPAPGDRRFKDAAWTEQPLFDYLRQSYLLTARFLQDAVQGAKGGDPRAAQKTDFYTRQFVDAMAPSNFLLTNPAALKAFVESNGESLVRGLDNLLADLANSRSTLKVTMTDPKAFEVGRNVATTPGKVVYRNALFELIQYAPATPRVYRRPLLIVPPWINKFYILDLRPENSFIRWTVERGYTVFVISWVNPDAGLRDKTFADYMTEGVLAALDAIERATGERSVNAIGYCIGGTLMAATLAWMAAKRDRRIASCTFFAAQVDFSEAGELQVFTDEAQVAAIEAHAAKQGYLDGEYMATTFNLLRANDLVWSFVVHNYLLGRAPVPFDLLYWNADATRLPAAMLSFYLRRMYLANALVEPDGIALAGVPIDLRRVAVPVYIQASKEDHIAPFRSVYKAMHLFAGTKRFVLAGSGHIAGVINPPAAGKYQHWTYKGRRRFASADDWLAAATETAGSWWPDWERWLKMRSGARVAARSPGAGGLTALADAPGTYVKVRA